MILVKEDLNLLMIALVMILQETLQRLIGQKSLTDTGSFTLGIREITVEFHLWSESLWLRIRRVASEK